MPFTSFNRTFSVTNRIISRNNMCRGRAETNFAVSANSPLSYSKTGANSAVSVAQKGISAFLKKKCFVITENNETRYCCCRSC
jgi:hypothetical protein